MTTTRKLKADRLRDRGIAVPNTWSEDQIDAMLAEVEAHEMAVPPEVETGPASPRG